MFAAGVVVFTVCCDAESQPIGVQGHGDGAKGARVRTGEQLQ